MGIYGHYYHLPTAELQAMLDDQSRADRYFGWDIDEEDGDWLEQEAACDARVRQLGGFLDIQRAWHAIHFLLTGDADIDAAMSAPPGKAVMGGTETDWEASVGTARYMMPDEVVEVAAALEEITDAELRESYQPEAFQREEIYPGGDWEAADLEPLLDTFHKLQEFYRAAAKAGNAMILALS